MPYIKMEDRTYLLNHPFKVRTVGELNYIITMLVQTYLSGIDTVGYAELNSAIGCLECAKLEFYRRRVTPYEHEKIFSNGDVY
jgi:hypothetical protein